MKGIATLLLIVSVGSATPRASCGCKKLREGSPEMGTPVVHVNGGRVRAIRGTVYDPRTSKPLNEAIIELYENHSRFRDENIPTNEAAKIVAQLRKIACMTASDGEFCFTGLKPGNYLLRIGTLRDGEVSGAEVLVTVAPRDRRSSSKGLRIKLGMSL